LLKPAAGRFEFIALVVDILYLNPQEPSFRVASIRSLEVFRTSTLSW
jgi:hypothetical protein